MLEQLIYKNHMNEVFEFGKDGIYVNMSDIRNYAWETSTKGRKISGFKRSIGERKLPIVIICDTEAQGVAARNRLFEVTEKDVLAVQHGKVIIGDYYFRCFVTKSEKEEYLTNKRYMVLTLTLTSDFPFWVKETEFIFNPKEEATAEGKNLDYNNDFPYDYSLTNTKVINNTDFTKTNFRMIIYGVANNPTVYIAGHVYRVNCVVGANEYLTIDSITKKITLTNNIGEQVNMFNKRDRSFYIFERIPPGNNSVALSGDFSMDIILLEERSEPKWT